MRIKRLHIQKMPGFPTGLNAYDNLADHINIIAGANGTGKSSTARVIRNLIWWNKKINLQATADFLVNGRKHHIRIDAPFYYRTDPQGMSSTEDFRAYVSDNFENQYILALHDLVKGDDGNLAKEIVKEVNGGYDLDEASRRLSYANAVNTINKTEYREFTEAQQIYNQTRKEQNALKEKVTRIEKLREELSGAKEAKSAKEFYTQLLGWQDMKQKQERITEQFRLYVPQMGHLRPDDLETADRLEKKIRALTTENESIEQKISDISLLLAAPDIPARGVDDSLLDELEIYRNELKEKKKQCENLRIEMARQELSRQETASKIGLEEEPEIHIREINDLDLFVREANRVEAEYNAFREKAETVRCEIEQKRGELALNTPEPEVLTEGIKELSRWLKQESAHTQRGSKWIWLAIVCAGLTIPLVWMLGYLGFISIFFAIALLLYERLSVKKEKSETLLSFMDYYYELGLEPPTEWNSREVADRINALLLQQEKAYALKSLLAQEKELAARQVKIEKHRTELQQKYRELSADLPSLPDYLERETDRYNAFYFFMCHLLEYQKSSLELQKKRREYDEVNAQYEQLLAAGNQCLLSVAKQPVAHEIEFDALVKDLRRKSEQQRDLSIQRKQYEQTLLRNRKQQEEHQAEIRQIYQRLGEPDSIARIREWTEQLPAYQTLVRERDETAVLLREREEKLAQFPFFQETFKELTREEIWEKHEALETIASKYEPLLEEIKQIEAQANLAASGDTLEKAISRRDKTRYNLESLFEENLQAVTGSLLIGQLRQEISLNNENKVFREANRIMGDITGQRYGLTLSDTKEAVFRAVDHVTKQILTLQELSTGTRVQLLLAVRLAYIESLEKDVRLPILADELLANSDDQRSEAIIRALMKISRQRQVFYFTAQADEVMKWKSFLRDDPTLSAEVIILGNPSTIHDYQKPDMPPIQLIHEVPEPGNLSHADYGKLLHVPSFNLLEEEESQLHLWYLLTDVQQLHYLLKRGISCWGQLLRWRDAGNAESLPAGRWELLRQKTQLLQTFLRLYRTGRCRKIDKKVILDSEAITEVFIDKVFTLLDEAGGDPSRLLEALPSVPRLQKSRIEKLHDYLFAQGYIDDKQPLSPEEIRFALQAEVSALHLDPEEGERFINQFFFPM